MPHTVFKLAVFGVFLVSCSTSGIAPDVANFGDTVVKIAGRDARSPDAKTLPARVATARRADFAAANVQYQASDRDACEYNRPDLDTARFSDACRLVPVILVNDRLATAASEYDPEPIQNAAEVVVKAGNTALLQELLAGDIREALVEYAKELETLATTKDPSEIGTAAGKAFDAVTTLKDATTAASTRTGKPPPPSATRKPRRNLITRAATEAAELLRYRALTEVVRSADPCVSAAAVQMAALTFRGEAPELER